MRPEGRVKKGARIYFRVNLGGVACLAGLLDMLRYDCAHPATQDDVTKLCNYLSERGRRPVLADTLVGFMSTAPEITPDRWKSFGFTVLNCEWR